MSATKANVFMSMFLSTVGLTGCLKFKTADQGKSDLGKVELESTPDLDPSPADMATYPSSCMEAGAATDTDTTLYIGGDQAKSWTAFCHADKEYLTVPSSATQNFSQYTAGGSTPGTNIVTKYTKIRIDPGTLKVDATDVTFSTSTGSVSQWPSSMTYATAADCMSNSMANGLGNVDLTGTPFSVAPGAFTLGGAGPIGVATYSSGNQVVALTGGGSCGWNAPTGVTPASPEAGWSLQLIYTEMVENASADLAGDPADLLHAAPADMAQHPADMSCAAFVSSPSGGQPACTPAPTEYLISAGVCYFRNCGCMNTTTCTECFQNPWQQGGGCP